MVAIDAITLGASGRPPRATMPRAASSRETARKGVARVAIYEIRSKRVAVHFKGIDPRYIDGSLAVHAAAWVIAELLRLYHASDERVVAQAMAALMRGHVPFVEIFGDERVVTRSSVCRRTNSWVKSG